jgi:hypothetical protein
LRNGTCNFCIKSKYLLEILAKNLYSFLPYHETPKPDRHNLNLRQFLLLGYYTFRDFFAKLAGIFSKTRAKHPNSSKILASFSSFSASASSFALTL